MDSDENRDPKTCDQKSSYSLRSVNRELFVDLNADEFDEFSKRIRPLHSHHFNQQQSATLLSAKRFNDASSIVAGRGRATRLGGVGSGHLSLSTTSTLFPTSVEFSESCGRSEPTVRTMGIGLSFIPSPNAANSSLSCISRFSITSLTPALFTNTSRSSLLSDDWAMGASAERSSTTKGSLNTDRSLTVSSRAIAKISVNLSPTSSSRTHNNIKSNKRRCSSDANTPALSTSKLGIKRSRKARLEAVVTATAIEREMLRAHGFGGVCVFLQRGAMSNHYRSLRREFQSSTRSLSLAIDATRASNASLSTSVGDDNVNENDAAICRGTEYYEVEKVLAVRQITQLRRKYLLKWKGYSYKVSSWESNVSDCAELLQEYQARQRALNSIVQSVCASDIPLYKTRYTLPNFFTVHKWEDQLTGLCARAGQGAIYVENWVEPHLKILKFEFITTNKITDEARALFKPPPDLTYCACDSLHCGSSVDCCPDIFGMKFPYTSNGRVRQRFDLKSEWLIECSDGCACGVECPTRVVQRGRQIPVVIFRTSDRGWSIRTLAAIKANAFVMEYVGKVITLSEAARVSQATYQFEMDFCGNSAFVVDALHYGNEARFVNHSCNPNMVVYGVFSDRYDMRYHRIAYFAKRDIAKGEELTINYFSKHTDDEFKQITRKKFNKSCFCRATNCRGFIL